MNTNALSLPCRLLGASLMSALLAFAVACTGSDTAQPDAIADDVRHCTRNHCPYLGTTASADLATSSRDLATAPQDLALATPDLATPISSSAGPSLAGCPMFPSDNAWNTDISTAAVHPSSAAYVTSIGSGTAFHPDWSSLAYNGGYGYGIPFTVVPGTQAMVPITFVAYPSESDPGPYPIPNDVKIEGGPSSTGDRHGLILDTGSCYLYEVYELRQSSSGWQGDVGAIWHMKEDWTRPKYWTSADAAGLPILPGLVRYDEVLAGEIRHALRFTVQHSQKAFIAPASHYASSSTDPTLPPMGLRMRLKASVDETKFPARMQVIVRALKRYGMFVADNGGNWYVQGAPDSRWDDNEISTLSQLHGSDFEAVQTGPLQY